MLLHRAHLSDDRLHGEGVRHPFKRLRRDPLLRDLHLAQHLQHGRAMHVHTERSRHCLRRQSLRYRRQRLRRDPLLWRGLRGLRELQHDGTMRLHRAHLPGRGLRRQMRHHGIQRLRRQPHLRDRQLHRPTSLQHYDEGVLHTEQSRHGLRRQSLRNRQQRLRWQSHLWRGLRDRASLQHGGGLHVRRHGLHDRRRHVSGGRDVPHRPLIPHSGGST